jgi:hypothetical protein
MLDTLLKVELQTNDTKTKQINTLQNTIEILRKKELNLNEIISNQDAIKNNFQSDLKKVSRQLYIQKIQKNIIGGLGVLTSGIFLYLYVTK